MPCNSEQEGKPTKLLPDIRHWKFECLNSLFCWKGLLGGGYLVEKITDLLGQLADFASFSRF
jgi:hypothetical protein